MTDDSPRLLSAAERLIDAARRSGADAADVAVIRSFGRSASVRLGEVEEIESSEGEDVSLRVFVGECVATISANMDADFAELAERAVAMAKVSPVDSFAGLADPARLARDDLDLDLFDPTDVSSERMVEEALAMEDAARSVPGVTNSGGASVSAGSSGLVLATSTGFSGYRTRSGFSRSVSVVAGEGTGMQRDYDFDSRIHYADLDAPEAIGRRAGERTVRRHGPKEAKTGRMPIIFDPRVARGLVGSLIAAINGAAIARRTSFLQDMLDKQILPETISVVDDPLLRRRSGSRPFDGEGVRGERLTLVEAGVLKAFLLDTATGRELDMEPNGRAARSGGGVSPSATNVEMTPGALTPEELITETGEGIYVDELIGHGANLVTGDYSRGAGGFMIRGGKLAEPVAELTIAGNLKDMLRSLTPANDLDRRFSIVSPTLRIASMTVAGQ